MSKHTKGPWSHRNGRIFQTDHEVLTIANVARAYDGDYSPSNGDLLAAAPELLEALEAMLEVHGVTQAYAEKHIEIPQSWVEVSDLARAAIAKAKGEK